MTDPAGTVDHSTTLIVGAGISGLICAIVLQRAGVPVRVLEQASAVGGRVQTTVRDGLVLDHGFQVLFTAYPTLQRYLAPKDLDYRSFTSAAMIARNGSASLLGDAWRDPSLLLDTVLASSVSLGDKLRLFALRQLATRCSIDDCFGEPYANLSTRQFLQQRGFGVGVIDGFFAPFYGGILLDRSLSTSASLLLFTFKMLAEGETVLPSTGIGALSEHLAAQLSPGTVETGVKVERITTTEGRVSGVVLGDGTLRAAAHVVLATEPPAAARLARTADVELSMPMGSRGCTTVYYMARQSPIPGKALWLNASVDAVVSHAVTLTDVVPEYASNGRTLVAATAVGEAANLEDAALDVRMRSDLLAMGNMDAATAGLERVGIWRVPYSQFAQPPGWLSYRASTATVLSGMWIAGEAVHSSSLEGAARGGETAAKALLQSLGC